MVNRQVFTADEDSKTGGVYMSRLIGTCVAAAAIAVSVPAEARRTVVDSNGSVSLSGYCDLNGDDCVATPLGFTIDFAGTKYDSMVLYGNGLVTFGNTPVAPTSYLGATNLATLGAPVISAGLDNTPDMYFAGGFVQSAVKSGLDANNHLGATFTIYLGSSSSKVESTLDIAVSATGLDVTIYNYANGDQGSPFGFGSAPFTENVPQLAGYSVAGVGTQQAYIGNDTNGRTPYRFFIPGAVTFGSSGGAVPEPATWAMMLLGFGAVGGAVRHRRKGREARGAIA